MLERESMPAQQNDATAQTTAASRESKVRYVTQQSLLCDCTLWQSCIRGTKYLRNRGTKYLELEAGDGGLQAGDDLL